jgi:hypothetical protein
MGANAGRPHDEAADGEQAELEADHGGVRVARMRAVSARQRDREKREAEGGHADADPLPGAHVEAEDAVGEDREEDQPGRDDRLHERQRRERHGRDVEDPGADGDAHTDREPLRRPEVLGALKRVLPLHGGRSAGSTMLEQEGQVREESA